MAWVNSFPTINFTRVSMRQRILIVPPVIPAVVVPTLVIVPTPEANKKIEFMKGIK